MRQDISSREKGAEGKKERMDYIPLLPGWMKLNYSSSINEQGCVPKTLCFQILLCLGVSMKEVILSERNSSSAMPWKGTPSRLRNRLRCPSSSKPCPPATSAVWLVSLLLLQQGPDTLGEISKNCSFPEQAFPPHLLITITDTSSNPSTSRYRQLQIFLYKKE